jgi:hypothetical protein
MINVVELKAYLNITDTSKDNFLADCCNKAISELETLCNRKFTSGTYTEYYFLDSDVYELYLKNYPVRELTSSQYESSDGTFTDVTDDITDITIIDDSLLHIAGGDYFPKGLIKTIYTAGFQVSGDYGTPNDFKKVLLEMASMHYYNSPVSTQARLGVTNKNIGSQNTTSATYQTPDHSDFINKYRIKNI